MFPINGCYLNSASVSGMTAEREMWGYQQSAGTARVLIDTDSHVHALRGSPVRPAMTIIRRHRWMTMAVFQHQVM